MKIALQGQIAEVPPRQPRGMRTWACRGKGLSSGFSPWFRLSVGDRGGDPEVTRSVCGETCQSQNPAHTAPPPGGFRKLPAGPG